VSYPAISIILRPMKTQALLSFLLILTGCVIVRGAAGPNAIGAIDAEKEASAPETPPSAELLKEPERRIRLEAKSWPELVDKAKPTLSWSTSVDEASAGDLGPEELGCYLMWIAADGEGRPQFSLEAAYTYQPDEKQPVRWVLLAKEEGRDVERHLNIPPSVAKLVEAVPKPEGDAEYVHDYALAMATDDRFGTVYEIGWNLDYQGNADPEDLRLLYVLQDRAKQWHFIGEGPTMSHFGRGLENGWGWSHAVEVQRQVAWRENAGPDSPVEVHFQVKSTDSRWYGDADTLDPILPLLPNLVTNEDAILAGKFPSGLRVTSERPYLLTANGETFERIVQTFGSQRPGWDGVIATEEAEYKQKILQLWRDELTRLNPSLPKGAISIGTRVLLPTGKEVGAIENELNAWDRTWRDDHPQPKPKGG
jgi:hypothetical protein